MKSMSGLPTLKQTNGVPCISHPICNTKNLTPIDKQVYNIERSCSMPAQRVLGIEQVLQVLPTITRLKALIPQLLTQAIK